MKKIISLILAVVMLSAMMITASAMNKDGSLTFRSDVTEVTVGDEFTVYLYVTADSAGDCGLKQTTFKYEFSDTASFVAGTAAGYLAASYANVSVENAGQATIMDTNKANWTTESGDFVALTFKAETAGTFTITNTSNNTQFQLIAGSTKNTVRDAAAPLSITIKANAPAGPVEEEVTSAAVACAKEWTALKSAGSENTNTYTNVAVATGSVVAGAKEAGFKFVKDDVNNTPGANFVVLDASAIAGEGTTEYTTIMYAVDYSRVSTIYAIPYYVVVR